VEVIELPADLRLPSLQANNLPDNLAHCDRQCTAAVCGCVAEIQYIRRKNCGFGCPQSAKRQGITRCSQSFPLARRCVIATLARAGRSFNVETASPSIQCHAQQAELCRCRGILLLCSGGGQFLRGNWNRPNSYRHQFNHRRNRPQFQRRNSICEYAASRSAC